MHWKSGSIGKPFFNFPFMSSRVMLWMVKNPSKWALWTVTLGLFWSTKQIMIKELAKTNQNLRLILATVVLGMILNAKSVKRIKICTVNKSWEIFARSRTWCAGCSGQPSMAVMLFFKWQCQKPKGNHRGDKNVLYGKIFNDLCWLTILWFWKFDFFFWCEREREICCSNCKICTCRIFIVKWYELFWRN